MNLPEKWKKKKKRINYIDFILLVYMMRKIWNNIFATQLQKEYWTIWKPYISNCLLKIYFFVWMICFVLYISLSFSLLNVIFSVAKQSKKKVLKELMDFGNCFEILYLQLIFCSIIEKNGMALKTSIIIT